MGGRDPQTLSVILTRSPFPCALNWPQEHKLDYKQLMAEYKAIKEGKSIHRKMCKWADECKYKHKCRFTHPCDLRKEEEERKAADPVQLSRCVRLRLAGLLIFASWVLTRTRAVCVCVCLCLCVSVFVCILFGAAAQ